MPTLNTQHTSNNRQNINPLASYQPVYKKRSKISWVGLLLMLGLLATCLIAGSVLIAQGVQAQSVHNWLSDKPILFLILRLIVLILFYLTWPMIVHHRCRHLAVSQETINKLVRRRYWVVLVLMGIDIVLNL